MPQIALFIRHKTLPGRREQVRAVWERHMPDAIAANAGHIAYFYCFANGDPDSICAFQQYMSADAAGAFLNTAAYQAHLGEAEPLLAGPPEVTALTPQWSKKG
jgi:quinol monooxygenase YgiN